MDHGMSFHFAPQPSTLSMSDEPPRTAALYNIADDLGQKVSNVCASLLERQR
jgi:hypothetical protein